MKKEKGDFEFVKDENDSKRNYIFKKDGITTKAFYIIAVVLVVLVLAVIFTARYLG